MSDPATVRRARGSLVVVGTGIGVTGQITLAAVEQIKRAEAVLFAVSDAVTITWIRRLNPAAVSLADCYAEGKPRRRTYVEMADRIVAAVDSGRRVCAIFYGHPGFVVAASHAAIARVRRRGLPVRMLPGISANDCLIADLGINPANDGFQGFEATDFLLHRRRWDPTSGLVLWQVGVLGEAGFKEGMICRPERLRRLAAYLRQAYPAQHRVVLYEAAQFPICDPLVQRTSLAALSRQTVRPITTVYVPPLPPRVPDRAILRWFDDPTPPRTDTTVPRSASVRTVSSSRSRRRRS